MAKHTIEQGEYLASVAKRFGFADGRTIFEHAENAALRRKRPDGNLLFPGDVLFIPEKEEKSHPGGTEQLHRFRAHAPTQVLRLAVEDSDHTRLANMPYKLEVDRLTFSGATDADGILEHPIPPNAETGKLTIGKYIWPLQIGHLNPVEDAPDDGISGMQARLRNLGYNPGPIDGVAGAQTKSAVRRFQRDNPPLKVDGICGPKTKAKLIERHGC